MYNRLSKSLALDGSKCKDCQFRIGDVGDFRRDHIRCKITNKRTEYYLPKKNCDYYIFVPRFITCLF